MTTAEENQVGAFSLSKGRFDLLIRERRVHLLQPLVLDGRGATGTTNENTPCSWFEFAVGLVSAGPSLPWRSSNSLPDRPL